MRAIHSWEYAAVQSSEVELADGRGQEVPHERLWRYDAAEVLGVARCPCCQTELVARQGRAGPYFACRCPVRRARGGD